MYQHTLWLAGLILAGVVSIGVTQDDLVPLQGPIDVQALRAQVLGNSASFDDLANETRVALPEPMTHPLGITFGEIPELLYLHCPDLADGRGLLIEDVCQKSPAHRAGLKPGHILLQLGDRILRSPDDLPVDCKGVKLYLLDHGKVHSATVPKPRTSKAPCPRHDHAKASARGNAPGAVAIAMANGFYQISTQVETEDGLQEFRIEGTREEVERQLLSLPENAANAIRSQL